MDRFRIPVCAVGAACRGMCGINHKTKHTLSKNPESRPEDGWEKAEAPYSVLPSAAHDKFRSICTTNDLYTEFKFVLYLGTTQEVFYIVHIIRTTPVRNFLSRI